MIGTKDKSLLIYECLPGSGVQQIFEQKNHHEAPVYCSDWSQSGRLLATGSFDKSVKLLVCPEFEEPSSFVSHQ